jgi:hypothetical protein
MCHSKNVRSASEMCSEVLQAYNQLSSFLKILNLINNIKPATKNIPPTIIIIIGFKSGLTIRKIEDIIIKMLSNLFFI